MHNTGPLYVGGDPFMSGTAMFLDELKVYTRPLSENALVLEANAALGPAGPRFVKVAWSVGIVACGVGIRFDRARVTGYGLGVASGGKGMR